MASGAAPSATAAHSESECPAQLEPGLGFHAINRKPFPFLSATPFYQLDRVFLTWTLSWTEMSSGPCAR